MPAGSSRRGVGTKRAASGSRRSRGGRAGHPLPSPPKVCEGGPARVEPRLPPRRPGDRPSGECRRFGQSPNGPLRHARSSGGRSRPVGPCSREACQSPSRPGRDAGHPRVLLDDDRHAVGGLGGEPVGTAMDAGTVDSGLLPATCRGEGRNGPGAATVAGLVQRGSGKGSLARWLLGHAIPRGSNRLGTQGPAMRRLLPAEQFLCGGTQRPTVAEAPRAALLHHAKTTGLDGIAQLPVATRGRQHGGAAVLRHRTARTCSRGSGSTFRCRRVPGANAMPPEARPPAVFPREHLAAFRPRAPPTQPPLQSPVLFADSPRISP